MWCRKVDWWCVMWGGGLVVCGVGRWEGVVWKAGVMVCGVGR